MHTKILQQNVVQSLQRLAHLSDHMFVS